MLKVVSEVTKKAKEGVAMQEESTVRYLGCLERVTHYAL